MNRSYSKIRHIQESNQRLENRLLNEQVTTGATQTTGTTQTTGNTETRVAGPFGQYYIYNKGGKFYIYQTNASQKTPILMQGTLWSNNGQGYNTQDDANKAIQLVLQDTRKNTEEMMEDVPTNPVTNDENN